MKILVINSGSSSLKYKVFEGTKLEEITSGIVERIGLPFSKAKNHEEALRLVLKKLPFDIYAIGHRVVHGGEKHNKASILTPKLTRELQKLSTLAPLHNPHNLEGILACKKLFPRLPQVAAFDTAFHATMPTKAFTYAIPEKFYLKQSIRRYGFHGLSHQYVTDYARRLLKNPSAKIISCHLGNGSSITASKGGKSQDTSMGFTPMEGLPMGTRSGNIDPGIIFHLHSKLKLSPEKIEEILQTESGLRALSGNSSDMRKIWTQAKKGNKKARFCIEILAYKIAQQISAYLATLNGVDAIIFTGGMGSNAYYLRQQVCEYLGFIGLKLNKNANQKNSLSISSTTSKIKVLVIPTNEELQIAKETLKTINEKR